MALPDLRLCLTTRSQDCSLAKIEDESEYGIDGADARNAHAQYLLAYKMDEFEKLTLITGLVNSTPLTTLEWSFAPVGVGAYRFAYIFVLPWSSVTAYEAEVVDTEDETIITSYADVVYLAGKLYKALEDNTDVEPGVDSGWEDSWVEVTDLETLVDYVGRTTIVVKFHDDIITCSYDGCVRDYLDDTAELILKGHCDTLDKILPTLKAQLMLDGARSANWQDKQTKAEVILVEASKKCCNKC